MSVKNYLSAIMLLAIMLSIGLFSANQLHAQTFTQEHVDGQMTVVTAQLEVALTEYVKLLQMIFIQHLEERLAELQANSN
jgi:sensor domain CHASE-containing protein